MARRDCGKVSGGGCWLGHEAFSYTEASGHDRSHVSGEKHDPRVIGGLTESPGESGSSVACLVHQPGMQKKIKPCATRTRPLEIGETVRLVGTEQRLLFRRIDDLTDKS
jgi:hypothetical protein